jgi:hypothetical protein
VRIGFRLRQAMERMVWRRGGQSRECRTDAER